MPKKARAKRRKPTERERARRREDERHRMQAAIEQLTDSEGWKRWLRARGAFRTYSFRNQLLIVSQRPDATHVASYGTWQKLGYQVRRGTEGIWIWAPCHPSKKRIERWQKEGADPKRKPKTFYRMVKVHDASQVDPIPDHPGGPVPLEPPPHEPIAGDGLAHLFEPLVALAKAHDYTTLITEVKGRAEAFCNRARRVIGVQPVGPDFSVNRQIRALVHEAAHMLVATVGFPIDLTLSYGQEEVIVECVAALVCASFGLDISESSAPYIAGWGSAEQIERYAAEIDRLAAMIEDAVSAAGEEEPKPDPEPPTPAEPALALVA